MSASQRAARQPQPLTRHTTAFAVGDLTDVPESTRASAARDHADVVAANIGAPFR